MANGQDAFIEELCNGSRTAYEKLLHLFGDKVYNTVFSLLLHKEDAEDLTQDVFIEIHQSIKNFRKDSSLSTWIYRITVSKSLEHLRRKKRIKRGSLFRLISTEELTYDAVAAVPDHPGILLENKERASILFAAINLLPENQKVSFILHKTEGLSYAEIADVLRVSVPAVESLLVRARQNLREKLKNYYKL